MRNNMSIESTQNTQVNVKISGSLREFINQQISPNGEYESASEYIRDLVRQDKRNWEQKENAEISAMLLKSINSPNSALESDFFEKAKLYAKEITHKNKTNSDNE